MKKLLILSLLALFFVSCNTLTSDDGDGSGTKSYMDISPESAYSMLAEFDGIYDVSPYYAKGHLPYSTDARGVDGITALATSLDKDGKYLVYCHADAPSIAGAEALAAAGITNVYRLEGNYGAWDAKYYVDISAEEAKRKIDAGEFMAVYDVSPHHAENHIPTAVDAYGTLATLIETQPMEKEYLVYCHADGPSMAGAQLMEDADFTNTFRLEGNYGAWVEAGYAVE